MPRFISYIQKDNGNARSIQGEKISKKAFPLSLLYQKTHTCRQNTAKTKFSPLNQDQRIVNIKSGISNGGRYTFILVLLCYTLSGCFIVPFIQSFKEIGVTAGDRMQILEGDLKKFHYAVTAGRLGKVLRYVQEDSKGSFKEEFRNRRRDEKIVDIKVDFVDFEEGAYAADVEVLVKYYEVPYYIVNERFEQERWTFAVSSGWKIISKEVVKTKDVSVKKNYKTKS